MREETFLELVRIRVYERPGSPYLKLLKFIGCDYSDLQTQFVDWFCDAEQRNQKSTYELREIRRLACRIRAFEVRVLLSSQHPELREVH
jgi:hypothetical protein